MQLYVWSSKVLQNYGEGQIVVMGESVEDARSNAIGLIESDALFNSSKFNFMKDSTFPDDLEEIAAARAQMKLEVLPEPVIYPVGMLITGSE